MKGEDVICVIKNSATLAGSLFTLHVAQIRIDLPTLTDKDKEVSVVLMVCFSCIELGYFLKEHNCWRLLSSQSEQPSHSYLIDIKCY